MTRQMRILMQVRWVGFSLLLVAAACQHIPSDGEVFRRSVQSGSPAALERFANMYPNSPRATEARQRAAAIEEAKALDLFQSVQRTTKASILERFMADYPFPKVILLAKLRIAEIDFQDMATKSPFRPSRPGNSSWEAFVSHYAFTNYIPVPQDPELRKIYYNKLHPLIIQALSQVDSFDLWMGYFSEYSENPYFTQAGEELEKFLMARSNKWQAYDMLKAYLGLWEEKVKRPCPNRDKLLRTFQEGLAEVVEREDTMDQYRHYLETFPDSIVKQRITRKMDHLILLDACVRRDRAKIREYIQKYEKDKEPQAQADVRTAVNQAEQLDFKDAVTTGTPSALRDFIARYKDRDYAKLINEANGRLQKIHDQMLLKAKAGGKPDLYREFLEAFPETPQKAEVERDLEETEFRAAIARNDRESLVNLLTRYPNSRMRQNALEFIEDQDFKEDKARALDEPSTVPLKHFLDNHPKGRRTGEAHDLRVKISQSHAAYMEALEKAREARNASQFGAFLIEQPNNHYVVRRGQKDLDSLRRELAIKQLVFDLTTTPTAPSKALVPIALMRALSEYEKAVALIETNVGTATGFAFGSEGLLLTNAHILRAAAPGKIMARIGGKNQAGKIAYLAEPDGLDLAVVRIDGTYDPIPLGNSSTLTPGEEVVGLWIQGSKVDNAKGTYLGTRRVGQNEWLVLQSVRIPSKFGGVVLNQRARAVGLLIPPDYVDPTVREKSSECVYAISLRSASSVMERVIAGP